MTADPEAAYFQTVEEYFVSRRGDPLFLSNADWLLVRKWRRAGVPLRVVLRGIADALDSHAHSFSREQKVRSLQYCAAEVERASERWRRALSGGATEGPSADIVALAALLDGVVTLGPETQRVARALAAEMRDQAELPFAEQSAWLGRAEKKLVRALEEERGPQLKLRLLAEVAAVLAPYRDRMPTRVLEQIREESYARRLLEAYGLPRLSLFHGGAGDEVGADAS